MSDTRAMLAPTRDMLAGTLDTFTGGIGGEFVRGLFDGDEYLEEARGQDKAFSELAHNSGMQQMYEGAADLPIIGDVVGAPLAIHKFKRGLGTLGRFIHEGGAPLPDEKP